MRGHIVAVLVGLALMLSQPVMAQVNQVKQLIGTWKVVSYRAQTVGEENWREPLGPSPKGYAILTAGGRYMSMIVASGRNAPTNDAERVALLTTMIAFSGRYTVEDDKFTVIVDTSWAEMHQGERQKQVRFFKIEGNKMTWRTPPQLGVRSAAAGTARGPSVTEIVLEREE